MIIGAPDSSRAAQTPRSAAPRPDGSPSDDLRPTLALHQAIAIIVGIVIGAGTFKAPAMVAAFTGDAAWMFGAWLLGGIVSMVGALVYA
ncbi:MAG: hypothetical protein AB7P21_25470 [Lautropia sp.]